MKSEVLSVESRAEGADDRTLVDPTRVDPTLVDPTLVDATLALTPEQRLRQNDRMLRAIQELRHGFTARRPDDAAVETGRSEG